MKVLQFIKKEQSMITSFQNETSEVFSVNFRKKEITKMEETNNQTGEVVACFGTIAPSPKFMGGGFDQIIEILLKKNA